MGEWRVFDKKETEKRKKMRAKKVSKSNDRNPQRVFLAVTLIAVTLIAVTLIDLLL